MLAQQISGIGAAAGVCFVSVAASWFQKSQLKGGKKAEVKTASPTSLWDVSSLGIRWQRDGRERWAVEGGLRG